MKSILIFPFALAIASPQYYSNAAICQQNAAIAYQNQLITYQNQLNSLMNSYYNNGAWAGWNYNNVNNALTNYGTAVAQQLAAYQAAINACQ